MTRSAALLLATSLLGLSTSCGITLDPNNPFDTADLGVRIVDIQPAWGPITGGNTVNIQANGLEGDIEVFFGNARLEPTVIDAGTVSVVAPNAGAPFTVDVTLRTDLGEDVRPGGYAFSDDGQPPDTGDTDPVGGTGLTGGLVEFARTQVACPTCLGMPAEFTVRAAAAFHTPVNASWSDWLPPKGQCVLNPTSTPPVSHFNEAGEWAYMQSGSTNISLFRTPGDSGPTFVADNLPINDYISNGSYDIDVPGGGALGPFSVTGVLRAAEGYDSVSPYELLYTGEAGAFTAQVNSAGQSFTWSPAGSGDGFLIELGAYDYYSGQFLGKLLCHGNDSGSMYIDTGAYMSAPLLLTVGMYRRKITKTVNPADGSTIEAIAMAGFIGTAVMEY